MIPEALRKQALIAYKHGLRATRVAFDGDNRVLLAARAEMRKGMENPDSSKTTQEQIQHLEEVATFLKRNLVQGQKIEGEEKYHLKIHKDIELGDNESIKQKTEFKARPFKKCSDN
ncbi:Mitochondrial zinc maintenance protein 1, mitochondrial [Nakaseomyces glabratus]|uniref:Mitochondrial zinc maintenance protein 1, mitochondrial n=1 Tax=Candida glabrata TaxID=5478 RepID=A0A0W0C6J9_CANGB|nr:Mitochondrial zinc maintenance protein 1, mitochondrial [Nakaseomyces glabratus]KTB07281.1 Mitochondrial zinc maintenance protein 1, mitochondrial [Nakaseomyces glabratus]KTB07679.1 Mitochondrial zinc maintenance protein 1, mitochondrial [Nakaseomyces glabratus]KTB21434.1 Mitochondrial zinc maintenance protein 1, mitochondrial [Nakaseomyces glabratus]